MLPAVWYQQVKIKLHLLCAWPFSQPYDRWIGFPFSQIQSHDLIQSWICFLFFINACHTFYYSFPCSSGVCIVPRPILGTESYLHYFRYIVSVLYFCLQSFFLSTLFPFPFFLHAYMYLPALRLSSCSLRYCTIDTASSTPTGANSGGHLSPGENWTPTLRLN